MHRGQGSKIGRGGDPHSIPLSDRGLDLLDDPDIREADRRLSPIVREVTRGNPDLRRLFDDAPLRLGEWRRGRTSRDRVEMFEFYKGVKAVEAEFEARYPGEELSVPVETPVSGKRAARWEDHRTRETRELLEVYEQWVRIKAERNVGSGRSREILNDEFGISDSRVRRAITLGNGLRSLMDLPSEPLRASSSN